MSIFFDFFLKPPGGPLKVVGRRKSRKVVGRRKSQKDVSRKTKIGRRSAGGIRKDVGRRKTQKDVGRLKN